MNISKPVAVHVDRLVCALAQQGIDIRRTKALELVAAAFGFHNTHECTAASKRGDLTPPAARPICRIVIPGGEALIVLRDPVTDAPYAIDETFVEQVVEDERREAYGPSPYGRLLDLSAVGDHPATSWNSTFERPTSQDDGVLRILVELDTDGPVSADTVRASVHNAVVFQRAENGLSADDDEGMVTGIETRILTDAAGADGATGNLLETIRSSGRNDIHVAVIHNRHGVELRLGTTLASVSRQVGDYVRENWDDAWQADQNAAEGDRADVPESPEGLDDDQAEEMYFQAVGRFSASDYVDYEVIQLGDAPTTAARDEAPPAEPFPGIPAGYYTVNASRDGDVINTTFKLEEGENEEDRGREIAAECFGLKLDDYYDDDHGQEDDDLTDEQKEEAENEARDSRNQNFDADIDSIEVGRASFDDVLLPILEASWAAAQKLPAGDPLRDVIRRQVMDAMPRPDAD